MDYTDLYGSLNPHLFRPDRRVPAPPSTLPRKTAHRSGLSILCDKETIFSSVSATFGFSRAILEDHEYTYPIQQVVGSGDFINVAYRWSSEYYHFLTEALPNALLCATTVPATTPIVCRASSFAEGLFRWFGLTNPIDTRVRSGGITGAYVECGNPSHDTIQRLRDVIESKLHFTQTKGILIRRHGTRTLASEDEILATFRSLYPDLDWVVFDTLSAEETATLFASAAVLVGPHGAGLTNMIFSSRGIRIYEFMPLSQPNLCYTHLSSVLGNVHTMIPTPAYGLSLTMRPSLRDLYLNANTGQIQRKQPFGAWIETFAKNTQFKRYMEIGSWNGKGSTLCFALGFLGRTDSPICHSFEINSERYRESASFWEHMPQIRIHNARILETLPNVRTIHSSIQSQWQADDEHWFSKASYVDVRPLAPEVVLLDGGEYLTYFEFQQLKPIVRVFLLDDTLVDKCRRIVEELSADPAWTCVAQGSDRNGWAIFQTVQ